MQAESAVPHQDTEKVFNQCQQVYLYVPYADWELVGLMKAAKKKYVPFGLFQVSL